MEVLEALHNRVSVARLSDPAPSAWQREQMFAAALRAPDHGQLCPWRFLTIEGAARERLGELFAQALQDQAGELKLEALGKALKAPLRAPLLVVVIACLREHPKVPELEQLQSAACAAHALLLAAHGMGLGAIWRTGTQASAPMVARGLGLATNERIVGFIYVGSIEGEKRSPRTLAPEDFVQSWHGPAIS